MHGGAGKQLRQVALYARPWQRALVGVGLVVAGLVLGTVLLTVLGGVFVLASGFAWLRVLRPRARGEDDHDEQAAHEDAR
jgi:hypothetical protein